ncbi:MAG: PhzF family phenazine biosynthesis protein [Clostridiales bacterium]|nr:PhzF family phenazine biosynthesis protein [Clostridiales bacterium]
MKYYIVDAFTDQLFCGNPAGVCLLDQPLDADIMQNIAFENNLSETAFVFKQDGWYDLKWFTPETEIDLCGHATLASAFVLMNFVDKDMQTVDFETLSGRLTVRRQDNVYLMDFPARKPVPCAIPSVLEKALGVRVLETYLSRDMLVLVESEADVLDLQPDLRLLSEIDGAFAFIVTAKGAACDFVSRFFAPGAGISEDPVTGSSHSTLIPFWSARLGKTEMTARQLSHRGGTLYCKDLGDRVEIGGTAALYLAGEIISPL